MVKHMREKLKILNFMDKELLFKIMEINILVDGKIIIEKEVVSLCGRMEMFMKEIGFKIKGKD